jgi:hypothetical protein
MTSRGRAVAQCPALLVQLEPGSLELIDHSLGELLAGIVRGMLSKEPAEQVAAPGQGEVDREHALPPGAPHYVFMDEETVVQISTIGPWGLTYVNPEDDPRQKSQ